MPPVQKRKYETQIIQTERVIGTVPANVSTEEKKTDLEQIESEKSSTSEHKCERRCLYDGHEIDAGVRPFCYPNRKLMSGEFGFDTRIFCSPNCAKGYLDCYQRDSPHLLNWLTLYCRSTLGIKTVYTAPSPRLLACFHISGKGITIKEFRDFEKSHRWAEILTHIPIDHRVFEPEPQVNCEETFYEVSRNNTVLASQLYQHAVAVKAAIPKTILDDVAKTAAAELLQRTTSLSALNVPNESSSSSSLSSSLDVSSIILNDDLTIHSNTQSIAHNKQWKKEGEEKEVEEEEEEDQEQEQSFEWAPSLPGDSHYVKKQVENDDDSESIHNLTDAEDAEYDALERNDTESEQEEEEEEEEEEPPKKTAKSSQKASKTLPTSVTSKCKNVAIAKPKKKSAKKPVPELPKSNAAVFTKGGNSTKSIQKVTLAPGKKTKVGGGIHTSAGG